MKSNTVILLMVITLMALTIFGVLVMAGMSTDLYNQKNINPFEKGSQTQLPIGSITTEGFENTAMSQWFAWSGNEIIIKPEETLVPSDDLTRFGTEYYKRYCQICHGSDLKKNKWGLAVTKMNEVGMLAPDLSSLTAFYTDQYIYLKIENGGTIMPRLGHIVIPEIRWQIIGYLRSKELQEQGPRQDN